MSIGHRPLAGCTVNISISEGDDSERKGFPSWQVNRLTLQVVSALFGQGANAIFGQDWREDGVMEAVYGFARQVQSPVPLSEASASAEAQPLLRNILPWPKNPTLSEKRLEQLRSTLHVAPAGLPEELLAYETDAREQPDAPSFGYIRARGLTHLRHRLNADCDARLCLGGRRAGSAGRYPGVIEEALLAVRDNKPLYIAGLLGGAAELVASAIEGKQLSDAFCPPTPINALYADPPIKETSASTSADRAMNREAIWGEFANAGIRGLAAYNGLTMDENAELLHTPAIDRAVELMLIGLSRIHKNLPGNAQW
jgi:hypothetical protein